MAKTDSATSRSSCPIACALDLIGDRWTLLVIRDLALAGKSQFGELGQAEGIATNVLADRLARLERVGVVVKERDPEDGRRRRYALTERGKDLIPVVMEIAAWGTAHTDGDAHPALIEAWRHDPEGLLVKLRAALR